jgi:hypothetical protein
MRRSFILGCSKNSAALSEKLRVESVAELLEQPSNIVANDLLVKRPDLSVFLLFSRVEHKKQLTVGRRRLYGPPLPTARLYI